MVLRTALQKVETTGLVEYSLGGHTCSRPPAVAQGKEDDHFDISPDPTHSLVWRPNTINAKALKSNNIASHLGYAALDSSPLKLVP